MLLVCIIDYYFINALRPYEHCTMLTNQALITNSTPSTVTFILPLNIKEKIRKKIRSNSVCGGMSQIYNQIIFYFLLQ